MKSQLVWYRDWIFYGVITIIVAIDQFTKALVKAYIPVGDSWIDIGIFSVIHGLNRGSAFGLFQGYTVPLIVLSIIGIAAILYFFRRQQYNSLPMRIALGFIVGGAIGNLLDRLKDGVVVDFISVGWWPAFNVADSFISVGMVMVATIVLLGERFGWGGYSSDEEGNSHDS